MERPNTILLVDNEAHVRKSTGRLLETKGYRIFTAATADVARRILDQERISLAIIDIRLMDDDDPNDVSGLDLAAGLDPHVAKIILTGFRTEEHIRRALIGYLNQVAPAQDVIRKQDGPAALLQAIERVFVNQIYAAINFSLNIRFDKAITLDKLILPLDASPVDHEEVEELFRRLFRREEEIKIYYMPPGSGGSSVMLVRPTYKGMDGLPLVVKFGPAERIHREVSAYQNYVEPFVHRRSTVMIGQPVRTQRLAACKLLFVGQSLNRPQDFNSYYRDPTVASEALQKTIRDVFSQSCGMWYSGKCDWRDEDGALVRAMEKQLSVDIASDRSELESSLENLLDGKAFHHVAFTRINQSRIRIKINGEEQELPDPLFFVTRHQDRLPTPGFAAITHGDLNGRNMFVDETGSTWLIDFFRTGWGPASRDAAELESAIKFELLQSTNLAALLEFERAILSPSTFAEEVVLPQRSAGKEFQRALNGLQAVREAAWKINETAGMDEYYALLLFYALKLMTWKGLSSIDRRRQPLRLRHSLYSAALLSAKFMSAGKSPEVRHIL